LGEYVKMIDSREQNISRPATGNREPAESEHLHPLQDGLQKDQDGRRAQRS